jgi:hypothetical protein
MLAALHSASPITSAGAALTAPFLTDPDRKVRLKLLPTNKIGAGVHILACYLSSNHIDLVAVHEAEDSLAVLLTKA